MNLDQIRETAIDSLFTLLVESELTEDEMRIINDCGTLLINSRSPEQVERMEKRIFDQKRAKVE